MRLRVGNILALSLVAGALLGGCGREKPGLEATGDVKRGASLTAHYGCGSCHVIPGIENARGKVGPPLKGLRKRVYLAGILTNDAENLTRWLLKPSAFNPQTAMPDVGLSETDARDVAAYLYTQ